MISNKIIKRYSNYNEYKLAGWNMKDCKDVDEDRLLRVIQSCRDLLKKPYLRFMLFSGFTDAPCVVYNGEERVTKLIPLSDVEQMIKEGKFHK